MEVELWEMEERRSRAVQRRSRSGRPRNGRKSKPIVSRSDERIFAAVMGVMCIGFPIAFGVVGYVQWAAIVAIGGVMLGYAIAGLR